MHDDQFKDFELPNIMDEDMVLLKPSTTREAPLNVGGGSLPIDASWTQKDYKQLKRLCQLQCTLREVAGWFDTQQEAIVDLIKRKYDMSFAEFRDRYGQSSLISLRRRQFKAAIDEGSVPMMTWLGKQYLDQKDKAEQASLFPDGIPGGVTVNNQFASDDDLKAFLKWRNARNDTAPTNESSIS